MKVGISFVDMEGAANNFEQEIASKNFGQVKQEATESVSYTHLKLALIRWRIYTI